MKPLFYLVDGGQLVFASTARAPRTGGVVEQISREAVADCLEFGYVTDDHVIYERAHKVSAGSVVEWSDGKLGKREYWSVPQAANSGVPGFEEAVEQTEQLLLQAVKVRLNADGLVGSLLSGGVDSALVCWAVAQLGANIQAFTISTPADPEDEAADAVAVAQRLGIQHEVIPVSADDTPTADALAEAYGEPFACASALGMLRVSRAVRESATVLLTGDGGDDVFLGYPGHRNYWLSQKLARFVLPTAARAWYRLRYITGRVEALRRPMHFVDYLTGGLGAVTAAHHGSPFYERHGILGERLGSLRPRQRSIPWSPSSGRNLLSEFLKYDR